MLRYLRTWLRRRDLFDVILKILYLVGIWPDEDVAVINKVLYQAYEISIHFLTFVFDVIATIGIFSNRHDPLAMAECFDKTLVAYNATIKVFLFTTSRRHLQSLVRDIKASGDTITKEADASMTKLVLFIYASGTSVFTAFVILAIFNAEVATEIWLPFDAKKNRMSALYGNELVAVVFIPNVWRMFGMQGLYSCLVMYLCEQLKDLQVRLRGLDHSAEMDEEVRDEFREIVKKHCRLIGYVKKMSKGFKDILLVQNLAVTVEMCLNAFMVSMIGTGDKLRLVNFVTFLMVTLFNAYIYCYLGNDLITQSEQLAQAAYEAPWTGWPLDMRRGLLTLLRSSQKPLFLSAGVSVMSLQTYCKIVYNGYSIFAMLYDVAN